MVNDGRSPSTSPHTHTPPPTCFISRNITSLCSRLVFPFRHASASEEVWSLGLQGRIAPGQRSEAESLTAALFSPPPPEHKEGSLSVVTLSFSKAQPFKLFSLLGLTCLMLQFMLANVKELLFLILLVMIKQFQGQVYFIHSVLLVFKSVNFLLYLFRFQIK